MKITNKDNRQTQENFESVDCDYQNNADQMLMYGSPLKRLYREIMC